jgi:hypothetical protein
MPTSRSACAASSPATRRSAPHVRDRRPARGLGVRPGPAEPSGITGVVIGRGSAAPLLPPISARAREAGPGWSASSRRSELGRGRGARGDSAPRPRAGPSREARSSRAGRVRRAARRARAPAARAGSRVRRSRGSAVSMHAGGGGSRRASGRRLEQGCVVACASRFSVRSFSARPAAHPSASRRRAGSPRAGHPRLRTEHPGARFASGLANRAPQTVLVIEIVGAAPSIARPGSRHRPRRTARVTAGIDELPPGGSGAEPTVARSRGRARRA